MEGVARITEYPISNIQLPMSKSKMAFGHRGVKFVVK